MRGLVLPALLAGGLCLAAGCMYRGIEAVMPGMAPSDVEAAMGPPAEVIHGDGADVGNKTYVYPSGRVHFVNQSVVLVERAEDQPTITERMRRQREREQTRPEKSKEPQPQGPQSPQN